MECIISFSSPSSAPLPNSSFNSTVNQKSRFQLKGRGLRNLHAISCASSVPHLSSKWDRKSSQRETHICRSGYHSSFCYDKPIPEEIIETPVALSEKNIGSNSRCSTCEARGAVPCATCSASGLYVDSIMESQGIIVKVRCLGCGGTGNIMCSQCGGWGHLGAK